MRFEHILQIYWTKGFFFGGKLFYFNQDIDSLTLNTPGLNLGFRRRLNQRFEWFTFLKKKNLLFLDYQKQHHAPIITPLNIILSQIHSVNARFYDLKKYNIVRLYLIKSYRGRCHALGKPVRGQRTWSNAWNAYNHNTILRNFIGDIRKQLKTTQRTEKLNYKVLKKKYASKQKKRTKKIKKTLWF